MISYLIATKQDVKAIAHLHTLNWQQNYRDMLSKNYLDNLVADERLEVWTKRFENISDNPHVIVAKENNRLVGFVCLYKDYDPQYGTLLDNLHVSNTMQGKGIGKQLLLLGKEWTKQQSPQKGMFLWVFESNHAAIKFYERMGGQFIETIPYPLMDGSGLSGRTSRFYWKTA